MSKPNSTLDTYVQTATPPLPLIPSEFSALRVESEADYQDVGGFLTEIKGQAKELKAQRDTVLQPLKAAVKQIEAWFKPALTSLDSAESTLKALMVGYRGKQAALQAQLAAQAQAEMASGNTSQAVALVATMNVTGPAAAGVSSRKTWKAVVTDETLVPREYLVVNESALNAVARATKGKSTIPGVEFVELETLAVRT